MVGVDGGGAGFGGDGDVGVNRWFDVGCRSHRYGGMEPLKTVRCRGYYWVFVHVVALSI